MPVLWHELITEDIRGSANIALAGLILSRGERNDLARLYGVTTRTVDRWFAGEDEQRLNCIPLAAVNKRLLLMKDESRLEYLRLRCFLPMLTVVPGGIERESGHTGPTRNVNYERPSLASMIQVADLVPAGLTDGGVFLAKAWERMWIAETGLEGPRRWRLTIAYRRPMDNEQFYEDTETQPQDIVYPEDYNEYDNESFPEYFWEPE